MSNERKWAVWEEGDFNFVVGAVGYPQMGKTRKLMQMLEETRRRYGVYIILHDPMGNLKRRFYPDLIRHSSIESLEQGLEKNPSGWHVSPFIEAEETLQAAWKMASFAAEHKLPPVVVYIDECVFVNEMQSSAFRSSKIVRALLTNRRQKNLGIFWGCQSPSMIHFHIFGMSTHCYIFKMTSKRDIQWLIDATLPEELADEVPKLEKLEYILYKPGVGETADIFDDLKETRKENY